MNIGVLGANGFLGFNLLNVLLDNYGITAIPGSRRLNGSFKVDATNYESLKKWISFNNITHVVNLAAMCGGIGLNKVNPYQLWSATTRITANTLDACLAENVEKVIMVGTVCSYAAECPVPFKEEYLMKYGMPEETNRAYGVSKLNGLIGAQAANNEFGMEVVNLVPVNMYGPYDHFDLENSHVIPAIINKVHTAINNGEKTVEVWGDGSPSREFLYVEDCAKAIYKALVRNNIGIEPINIGTGKEIVIRDLVYTIGDLLGFDGEFVWDNSKPNGQTRRCLDISRAEKVLEWKPITKLKDGLMETIAWHKGEL